MQSVDVRDDTLADGGLTGDDIANSSLNHLDVAFNGLTGQEINESLTESEIADGGLNDEDIAEGAFVSFSGSIGNVPAHDCVEKQRSPVSTRRATTSCSRRNSTPKPMYSPTAPSTTIWPAHVDSGVQPHGLPASAMEPPTSTCS